MVTGVVELLQRFVEAREPTRRQKSRIRNYVSAKVKDKESVALLAGTVPKISYDLQEKDYTYVVNYFCTEAPT